MYCDKDKNNKEMDKDDKRAVLSGWTAPRGQARLRPWRRRALGGSKCRRRRALGGFSGAETSQEQFFLKRASRAMAPGGAQRRLPSN